MSQENYNVFSRFPDFCTYFTRDLEEHKFHEKFGDGITAWKH
jgi:hypothetical protein